MLDQVPTFPITTEPLRNLLTMYSKTLLIIFASYLHFICLEALNVTVWRDETCRGDHATNIKAHLNLYPTPICNVRNEDENALAVKMESERDQSVYIMFYDSEDCNPDSRIGVLDDGCSGVDSTETNPDFDSIRKWRSWTVSDMCEVEGCALEL